MKTSKSSLALLMFEKAPEERLLQMPHEEIDYLLDS
jgi:hypothetical protein